MLGLVRNAIRRRELLWVLVAREIKGRYRQSFLGLGWALLQAPAMTLLFVFLRSLMQPGVRDELYFLKTYAVMLPWSAFSNAVLFSGPSLVRNAALLKKVYFPRETFVLAAVLTSLVDFLVAAVPFAVLMIWYHDRLHLGWSLVLVPVLLLIQSVLALGVGLFVAALGVFRRDIIFGMPLLLMFWLILSPVIYPLSRVPQQWRTLYLANPMAGVLSSFRSVLIEGAWPQAGMLAYAAIASFVILWLCCALFRSLEMRFADVV